MSKQQAASPAKPLPYQYLIDQYERLERVAAVLYRIHRDEAEKGPTQFSPDVHLDWWESSERQCDDVEWRNIVKYEGDPGAVRKFRDVGKHIIKSEPEWVLSIFKAAWEIDEFPLRARRDPIGSAADCGEQKTFVSFRSVLPDIAQAAVEYLKRLERQQGCEENKETKVKRGRGKPPLSPEEKEKQEHLREEWTRYRDSGAWKEKPGWTAKLLFCKSKGIERRVLESALRAGRRK